MEKDIMSAELENGSRKSMTKDIRKVLNSMQNSYGFF
jgi:hypothetical protein